jgi:hypothetical protein
LELEIYESLKTGGLKPQAIFERDEVERMLKGHAIQFEGTGPAGRCKTEWCWGAAAIWTHNIWI